MSKHKINPNHPAFPEYGNKDTIHHGLTKRKYFAVQLLAGAYSSKRAGKEADNFIAGLNKEK